MIKQILVKDSTYNLYSDMHAFLESDDYIIEFVFEHFNAKIKKACGDSIRKVAKKLNFDIYTKNFNNTIRVHKFYMD